MRIGSLRAACVSGALILIALPALAAQSITVGLKSQVKPDAQLTEFVSLFRAAITAKKPDYKKISAMFAPKVSAFSRSLDPLAPWNQQEAIGADYLKEIANIIVEQGAPEGTAEPDYRPDALAQMASIIGDGSNFGTIKELPNAICAPAEYKFSAKAITAFAKKYDNDAHSLRFYASASTLMSAAKAGAKSSGDVPAFTPIAVIYDAKVPEGWGHLAAANGISGYLKNDDREQLGFSQMHVCFGKVSGTYKVTGIFGYGL
jgi:hypothetical protein